MFEWKVEDMVLMNEKDEIFIGKEKIYKCEQELSREDKIIFIDSMQENTFSYLLSLIEKFNEEKDKLPKDNWGSVKTISLKAWIKRNDTNKLVDDWYRYGTFDILGVRRSLNCPNEKRYYDTYEDLVDEVFHHQLKICEEKERKYFSLHDEYSILKNTFISRNYNTTFGVDVVTCSNGDVYIADRNNNKRDITIDELKYLLSKYEELDELVEKITNETNIKY